ncbi:MAG: hypothetical protein R3B96_00920 [Pirellulaceae bacterium]
MATTGPTLSSIARIYICFAGDLPCPVISEEVMHRYLKFGEWDRWGKGRKKKRKNLVDDVRSPQERMDQIRNVLQATSSQPSLLRPRGNSIKGPFQIGIDIQGPGGGQWRLTEAEDGSLNVGIGLPLDPKAAIVRISVSELEKKVEEIGGPLTQFFRNLIPKPTSNGAAKCSRGSAVLRRGRLLADDPSPCSGRGSMITNVRR